MSEFWLKVDKTLRYHGRQILRATRNAWWNVHQKQSVNPVFVIGCSRAGTTLVYKTLSESKELGTLQRETHDFWVDLHPLADKNWDTHGLNSQDANTKDRDEVSRYFYTFTGKTRFIDKNNQNGLCIPFLHALFPKAHFIFVKRSPGDNINSLIEGWGKPEEFATWSRELKEKVTVENGRYTQWCFFLSDGWRNYLNKSIEEVCAFQYCAINNEILAAKKQIPSHLWSEVFYEDLVRNPVSGFRQAFEQCGLAFTQDIEQHCAHVLSTPYNAFSEIRLDKWKDGRNREKIERIMHSVAPTAQSMGYPAE
ncbi:sulfotransferase family protein [Sulfurirhabdus autotrophica]|uniref:Sulfotransferase family protein n=1 Tax=Sulfurirhabdus autotrophica TaxID=1706046 RepID=A0A4R3YCL4_9PROT|nr:sulfotransferase [Sulfurirhabdus autotrophica]TCV88143.1 sulfotransferase family protein [Sulfurirhabdus autotrophica]